MFKFVVVSLRTINGWRRERNITVGKIIVFTGIVYTANIYSNPLERREYE